MTAFRNESGGQIRIIGYNVDNQAEYTHDLENNTASPLCEIPSPVFLGSNCVADSIVFRFQNNKGYICSTRLNNSQNLCFEGDKSPFGGGEAENEVFYRKVSSNTFEFIITESDLENAFELPDQ